MTAADRLGIDARLAASARDRDKLLAALARDAAHAAKPYRVVRQTSHQVDQRVCGHRFELLAELCAYRRTRRHAHEAGGHYTVRRADA